MTFSSTDRQVPDERARSRASLGRLVAALLLGLAASAGATLESTSSFLTDQVTVDVGVTTAPDFASTPTPTATPTQDAPPSTNRKGRG